MIDLSWQAQMVGSRQLTILTDTAGEGEDNSTNVLLLAAIFNSRGQLS